MITPTCGSAVCDKKKSSVKTFVVDSWSEDD